MSAVAAAVIALPLALAQDAGDALRTAAVAAAVSAMGAIAGVTLLMALAAARPGDAPPALAILASSIVRMAAAVGIGLAVGYALRPVPTALWASIIAGWMAGKAIEIRRIWPLVTGADPALRAASVPEPTRRP